LSPPCDSSTDESQRPDIAADLAKALSHDRLPDVPDRDSGQSIAIARASMPWNHPWSHSCARLRRKNMRELQMAELSLVSGAANPHLVTVATNPGGVSNKSTEKNPNTQTYTYKTTGKPAR
jgi:hypothetical protein